MEQQPEPTGLSASELPDEVLADVAHAIVTSEGNVWPDDRSSFSSKPEHSAPENAAETDPLLAD